MAVFFNGQELVTPTTASVVNDDAMQNQNPSSGNAVVFVGKSLGGKPGVKLDFGTPEDAKAVLRGGEGMDAVVKAFSPSADTGSPQTVSFVRVNPATAATAKFKLAGGSDAITLTSVNYGQRDNTIKASVEAGTLSGKRVTVEQGSSYFSQDNVGRGAFTVVYAGTEATATISVTATQVVLSAPAATVVATIDLTETNTVGDLVDRINTVAGFSAETLENSVTTVALNGLDFVNALDVKTVKTVRADLQAIVDWLNSGSQPLVTAVRASGAGAAPVNSTVYLAGGSEGVTTMQQWADALEVLQTADVQWMTVLSSDPAIHSMLDAHVVLCSGRLKRERRAICGTAAGTSRTDVIAAAKALNSKRTSLTHVGHYDYDSVTGKLALRPPYMTAAIVAAMFAAANPGTPMTNKTINCRGLEFDVKVPTETDPLIKAGVLCVENTDAGYKVVRSITTWLGDRKYNNVEQSTGAALDFTVRNWRQAVDVLRGQKNNPLLLQRAITLSEGILKEMARAEPEGPGAIVGDAENPAFRNLKATIEGDVVRIQGEVSPAIPANYILVTVYANVYSGTVTA